jgi:hypothetical protein
MILDLLPRSEDKSKITNLVGPRGNICSVREETGTSDPSPRPGEPLISQWVVAYPATQSDGRDVQHRAGRSDALYLDRERPTDSEIEAVHGRGM